MDLKVDGVGEKGAAAAHEGYQDAYDSVQRLGAWRQVRSQQGAMFHPAVVRGRRGIITLTKTDRLADIGKRQRYLSITENTCIYF
jgi:hypothetical protein